MSAASRSLSRACLTAVLLTALSACGGGGGDGGGGFGPLSITTTSVDDGVVDRDYNESIATTGGRGTKTFAISSGALPAGLSMSASGTITGLPTGPTGSASFTVQVTDSANTPATDTQALTIDIVDPLLFTTAALADTGVGDIYEAAIAATGGTAPYSFTVITGELPAGIALAADGSLTGTVGNSATSESFEVQVEDSSTPAQVMSQFYTVRVALEVATTALADATGGVAYSDTLEPRGGLPPYSWTLLAGTLPDGLTGPSAAGTISGTPDAACDPATATLTVEVADSDTPEMTATGAGIELTVNPAPLAITTTALPNAVINATYDQMVIASGGVPPYSFAITSGVLPNGLSLAAATGRITGTPGTNETQAFTMQVTDNCPVANTASRQLGITVSATLGRNDSIADATMLAGNGTYSASISPSGDPNTLLDPDEDFYAITTGAASTVTIDINAVANGSPLDSVIEVLAANGVQLNTCLAPTFTSSCEHDDDDTASGQLDSFLQVQVPAGTTIYIHVVDWGSNARPDKLYDLVISGVN